MHSKNRSEYAVATPVVASYTEDCRHATFATQRGGNRQEPADEAGASAGRAFNRTLCCKWYARWLGPTFDAPNLLGLMTVWCGVAAEDRATVCHPLNKQQLFRQPLSLSRSSRLPFG
jgi:hypothetical protein